MDRPAPPFRRPASRAAGEISAEAAAGISADEAAGISAEEAAGISAEEIGAGTLSARRLGAVVFVAGAGSLALEICA